MVVLRISLKKVWWPCIYTRSPCLYHESKSIPLVYVNTMSHSLYHVSNPIPWVKVYTMTLSLYMSPSLYHVSKSIPSTHTCLWVPWHLKDLEGFCNTLLLWKWKLDFRKYPELCLVYLADPGKARACSTNTSMTRWWIDSSFSSHSFTAPPCPKG